MSLWYLTGTVTLTSGSNDVTGVGSAWAANAKASDIFYTPSGGMYEILSVSSDTTLRLVTPYSGPTMSGVPYAIVSTQGFNVSLAMAMTALIPELAQIRDAYAAGADPASAAAASAQSARDVLAGALKKSDLPESSSPVDSAPTGSLILGVTPTKNFMALPLSSLSLGGALRFNELQQLSDGERQMVLRNIGLNKIVEFLLPAGATPGQALVVDSVGDGLVARDLSSGGTPPGYEETVVSLATTIAEVQAALLEFIAGGGSGGGGTPTDPTDPTDPTVPQDFTNLVSMLDASIQNVEAKTSSLT